MRYALALVALGLVGCAARLVPAEAGSFRSPRLKAAAEHVLVLQNQDAGQPTEVLGVIDVHEPTGGQSAALETMKERAALLGADAVIGVEFHHEGADAPKNIETHLSGLAVRNRPVLADKPYNVLGQVEVDAEMGREQEGMDQLREKAGSMGADVLVDVQFQHGEGGGEKTHLRGIAIKYR